MCQSALLWNIKVILRLIIQDLSMFLNNMIIDSVFVNVIT